MYMVNKKDCPFIWFKLYVAIKSSVTILDLDKRWISLDIEVASNLVEVKFSQSKEIMEILFDILYNYFIYNMKCIF